MKFNLNILCVNIEIADLKSKLKNSELQFTVWGIVMPTALANFLV